MMRSKKLSWLLISTFLVYGSNVSLAIAQSSLLGGGASQDKACAIWLCGPYGFPEGCSDARSEFFNRLSDKSVMAVPSYSTCSDASPLSVGSTGSYVLGYAPYRLCPNGIAEGYEAPDTTREEADLLTPRPVDEEPAFLCIDIDNCTEEEDGEKTCETIPPVIDDLPYFVEFTIDGKTYPRYQFARAVEQFTDKPPIEEDRPEEDPKEDIEAIEDIIQEDLVGESPETDKLNIE